MLEEIISRLDNREEWICNLEDKIVETVQSEQQKEDFFFLIKGLRDLWDNIKDINICFVGLQKEKRKSKEQKTYLKK